MSDGGTQTPTTPVSADKNKVRFGLSKLYIAFISSFDADGVPTYSSPQPIPGAVSLSADSESTETIFWADNTKYYITHASTGGAIECEVAKFSDEILAEMLGDIVDAVGGLIEVNGGIQKQFALMGQLEGDISARRFCYFCCTGSKPNVEAHTTEDSITPSTETMTISTQPVPLSKDGKLMLKYSLAYDESITGNKAAYEGFFNAVYKPTVPSEGA
ncbi:MAG: major tail protein [Anaerovoracaceae bacterium]|jgi:phi13 family phage major tail protein